MIRSIKDHEFRQPSQRRANIVVRQWSTGEIEIADGDLKAAVLKGSALGEGYGEVLADGLHVFDNI